VNACHQQEISVILDVVYNHFGPEGNYAGNFGPYFSQKYNTPWGKAINYDNAYSDNVRRYFIQNGLYWLSYYHIDCLRLDAVHGIFDMSAKHFLAELAEETLAFSQKQKWAYYLIAESDLNDIRLINTKEKGIPGIKLYCLLIMFCCPLEIILVQIEIPQLIPGLGIIGIQLKGLLN